MLPYEKQISRPALLNRHLEAVSAVRHSSICEWVQSHRTNRYKETLEINKYLGKEGRYIHSWEVVAQPGPTTHLGTWPFLTSWWTLTFSTRRSRKLMDSRRDVLVIAFPPGGYLDAQFPFSQTIARMLVWGDRERFRCTLLSILPFPIFRRPPFHLPGESGVCRICKSASRGYRRYRTMEFGKRKINEQPQESCGGTGQFYPNGERRRANRKLKSRCAQLSRGQSGIPSGRKSSNVQMLFYIAIHIDTSYPVNSVDATELSAFRPPFAYMDRFF